MLFSGILCGLAGEAGRGPARLSVAGGDGDELHQLESDIVFTATAARRPFGIGLGYVIRRSSCFRHWYFVLSEQPGSGVLKL